MRPLMAWSNDNLTGCVSASGVDAVHAAAFASYTEHGIDPCTRGQAAAHEAGHVVVGYVYGDTIEGARIWADHRTGSARWVGANQRDHPFYHRPDPARLAEEPDRALRAAVCNYAGFAGEIAAGLEHPSSSIDERMKAKAFAAVVAEAWSGEADQVAITVMALCVRAIEENRVAFDTIRAHLYRTRRLTRAEAARMLARVERVALPTDRNDGAAPASAAPNNTVQELKYT